MSTILVSGASGIVGYGVLKALKGLGYTLVGTTIYEESPANCFSDVFEIAPKTNEDRYVDWLVKIIKKHKIEFLIPGIEADMIKWNQNRSEIEETGAMLLLNNSELIDLCSDKWLFYEEIKDNDFAIRTTLDNDFETLKQKFGLPFLLKPRRGFASKGIVKVENEEIFKEHKKNIGKILMVQPIVGNINEEYTISAFFDKNSKLLCHHQLRRKLSKEGFTEIASSANVEEAKEVIERLAQIFKPIGPTNFQFRLHNDKLKLLEINPRISSSTSIRTAFGYNESKMAVDYFLKKQIIQKPVIKKGKAIRYTEDFIEYDSTDI